MNALEVLMQECNNYFYKWKEIGTFDIANNVIVGIKGKYLAGQYVMIKGSILNDGVYQVKVTASDRITLEGLQNENFEGVVYGLAVPKAFVDLSVKIQAYLDNPKTVLSDISSESFNNYSWSKGKKSNGANITWNDIFVDDIRSFRKIFNNDCRVEVIK